MEKEERKAIQRLWEDIVWCVCRVGACLRAFVCIKHACPPQGPSGDRSTQHLPARESECYPTAQPFQMPLPVQPYVQENLLQSWGMWRANGELLVCHRADATHHMEVPVFQSHNAPVFPNSSHCWAQGGRAGSHITSCDCRGKSRAGAYGPPNLEVFEMNPFTLGSVSANEGWGHRSTVTLAETLDIWLHSWTGFPMSDIFPCKFYQIYLLRGSDSWSYDQSHERAPNGNS